MKRITRDHTLPPGIERYQPGKPAAFVERGESFVVETVNFRTPVVRSEGDVSPAVYREREETGPIYVQGVSAGDLLAIHIHAIRPEGHASGAPLQGSQKGSFMPVEVPYVVFPGGLRAPLRMMIGDIFCVPPSVPITNPRDHGGNLDFPDVCAGNTLLLNAYHDGGLLILGDVHASQGYGEVAGCAAECAAEVTLSVTQERRFHVDRPVILKEHSFICIAARENYWASVLLVSEDAAMILNRRTGCTLEEAYLYVTTVGDYKNGGIYSLGWSDRAAARGSPAVVGVEVPWPS